MTAPTRTEPAFRWVPEFTHTNGDIAAQVGEELGLPPDPDQRAILDATFAYRPDDPEVPVCFSATTVAPRQNIKTSTWEIAALTDLFVFREPLHDWSAHLYDTASKTFAHMVNLIDGRDDYRRLCRKPYLGKGDQAIELLTGERIEFHSRSLGSGRGSTVPRRTLDEALFLQPLHMGAGLPTLATFRRAQIRYSSSSGLLTSAVLRGIRDRGRKGGDPRSAYFEWSTEVTPCASETCSHYFGSEGCILDSREMWARANPAYGRRISEQSLADLRREMPAEEFAREFLGWWEDPPPGGGALDVDQWAALVEDPPELRLPSFGVDLDETGIGYFAVAWKRPDGLTHVQLAGRSTASKLQERADELKDKHKGRLYAGGPAAKLLKNADVVSMDEFAAACARLEDVFSTLRHCDEPELNDSVSVAKWRTINAQGARAWQLKDNPGIGPLAAVTRALHGLLTRGAGKGRALVLK